MRSILMACGLLSCLALAGCVTTSTTDIAPNVVRLDTEAGGALFQGQAGPETLRKAAEVTAARGYRCFTYADVQTGRSREYAGTYTTANASVYGGRGYATGYGTAVSTPVFRNTENVGATVVMDNTCGQGSWNAAQILAQKN